VPILFACVKGSASRPRQCVERCEFLEPERPKNVDVPTDMAFINNRDCGSCLVRNLTLRATFIRIAKYCFGEHESLPREEYDNC